MFSGMLPQVEWKIKIFQKNRADLNPCDKTSGTSEKSEFDPKDQPTPSPLTFMHLHFTVLLRAEEAHIWVIRTTLLSQPH